MVEEKENREQNQPVSFALALGTWVSLMLGFLALAILFVVFVHKPFGIQITTLIGYTAAVFFLVFFRWRRHRAYSLREKPVQREIPRLLKVHVAFLVLVFAGLSFAIHVRPSLPSYWLTEHGKRGETLFEWVVIVCFASTLMTQVYVSRKILSRSCQAEKTTNTNWV